MKNLFKSDKKMLNLIYTISIISAIFQRYFYERRLVC